MPTSHPSKRTPDAAPLPVLAGLSLDAVPIPTALSQNGTYLQANAAFLGLFGFEELAEILGRPLLDQIAAEQRDFVRGVNQERERTGSGPQEYETLGLRKDGSTFPMQVHVSGVPLAEGLGTLACITDISKRKQSEEALVRERQNAEQYLDVAQVVLVAFDAEARITLLNRKGYSVLGYEEGELVGRDWFRLCLPPEEYESVLNVYRRILSGELAPVEHHENHILRKDGERRLIAWNNAVIKDGGDRIVGMLSSGEDITERRQAEEAFAQANVLLEQSQILTKMGAWALEVRTGQLTWTPETYRLHEVDPQDFIPTVETAFAFYEPEYRPLITEAVGMAMETGQRYNLELKLRTAKGKVLWIRTIGTAVFEEGRCLRLLGTIQNITERKLAEAALREREEQIRVIFEASDAGIILVSPTGRITFANMRMAELFGMPLLALIGTTYPDHLHDSEKQTGDLRMRMIITGEIPSVSVERKFLKADGTTFWGHLSGRRLENPDGSLRALVGIISDVTKRREAEERQQFLQAQLHQAQKMESLGALAGGVAHDMNNVLGAILGLASAHIENQPPGPPNHSPVGSVSRSRYGIRPKPSSTMAGTPMPPMNAENETSS